MTTHRAARALRTSAAILLLLAVPFALSACSGSSAAEGDRLTGDLVVATVLGDGAAQAPSGQVASGQGSSGDGAAGPQIEVPESMSGTVSADDYRDDGAVGTRLSFSSLPLGQLNQLGDLVLEAYPNTSVSMDLSAKRSGDIVRTRGSADLTALSADRDRVSLTIQFAGPISATNGEQIADDTVRWTPEAGRTSDLTAEADYPDPGTAAFTHWTWVMVGITVAVVALVGGVAYLARDTSDRPAAPAARS